MEKKLLLTFCQFYDGAKENPFEKGARKNKQDQNRAMLWFCESCWCIEMSNADSVYEIPQGLAEYVGEYKAKGLETFMQSDGVPLSLKALLFNRYMRGSMDGDVEPFKRFYFEYYGIWDYCCKSRSQLIDTCHYYKGEKEPPEGVDVLFWGYEQHWVETVEREIINNERGSSVASWVREYRRDGLHYFEPKTDYHAPESLKALLYNRFSHFNRPEPEEFKDWFKKEYLGNIKKH